ncbi:MAG: ABC transporter ATP-binding protein [Desulfobacteraceae bacterium]|nr:MAG: ABC transporter ATP-binding protein [Desulfobacteraceae bacterium]
MAEVVRVDNLSRSFGETDALDSISFSVEEGEIFGLVGPDGAGKTTCLRILCGLMAPSSGQVRVLDQDMALDPEPAKDRIGYMAQPARLYEELSVLENIRFYADIHEVPPERYRERMNRLLEFSGLSPFTERLFRNLSGGMKQKVGLTCALIHSPRVLFLDEPTNGVDPVSRRDFWKILYELRRERVTIVVASTYLDEVDRCHRVALFDKGRIRLLMAPTQMRALITGSLYNLIVPDRQKALKVLRSVPQVIRSSVFGTGIHFTTEKDGDVSEVEKSLLASGLSSFEVKPITASLEDVYLSLVLEKEEAAER